MEDIKKYMTILNTTLLTKTFLVGERVTLADIAVCCNLVLLYKQVLLTKCLSLLGYSCLYINITWFQLMPFGHLFVLSMLIVQIS